MDATKTKMKATCLAWGIDPKAAFAEFVAMTLFVYVGCGSAASNAAKHDGVWDPASVLLISLTFGLAITVLAYSTAHTSGGQINCAVTFALVLVGKVSPKQGLANFVAQMLGSILGAALLFCATDWPLNDHTGGLGSNGLQNEEVTLVNAFVTEMLMTFLLVFVVLETAINKRSVAGNCAPIAIGLAVFMAHVVNVPLTGCSINPTRSFGPAVVADHWHNHWLWWVAPMTGSALAAFAGKVLFGSTDNAVESLLGV